MTDPQERLKDAKLALDRAHMAARSANGAVLRRSITEALEHLDGQSPDAERSLGQALIDLDAGALMELDRLLEDVRRQLAHV